MICLVLPRGHTFGWGVCGKYLTRELARLSPVVLLTEPFTADHIGDDLDYLLTIPFYAFGSFSCGFPIYPP